LIGCVSDRFKSGSAFDSVPTGACINASSSRRVAISDAGAAFGATPFPSPKATVGAEESGGDGLSIAIVSSSLANGFPHSGQKDAACRIDVPQETQRCEISGSDISGSDI